MFSAADPFVTAGLAAVGKYKIGQAAAMMGIEVVFGVAGAFAADYVSTRFDAYKTLEEFDTGRNDEYLNDMSNIMPAIPGEYRNTSTSSPSRPPINVRKLPAYFNSPHLLSEEALIQIMLMEITCSFLVCSAVLYSVAS